MNILTFKCDMLDKLERKKKQLMIDVIAEEEPYYKIKKSCFLFGFQEAIDVVLDMPIIDLGDIQKRVIKATFNDIFKDSK